LLRSRFRSRFRLGLGLFCAGADVPRTQCLAKVNKEFSLLVLKEDHVA